MFSKIRYELGQIQPEAVWENVLDADSLWCYADEKHFKRTLRECFEKNKLKRREAEKLSEYLKEEFSSEKQYERFYNSINEFLGSSQEEEGWQNILNKVVNYD